MKGFRVTADGVKELLELGAPVFFIDARTKPDWEKTDTKVKGALRIQVGDAETNFNKIPRDRTVITY